MAITWKKLAFEADVVANTTFNAKGDVLTATADDTPSILTVGANTHVLTADSGEAKGVKWAAVSVATLDAVGDVAAITEARGQIIFRAAAAWDALDSGAQGAPLLMGANDPAWGSNLKHEFGGLEADVNAYDGLVKISGGATSAVTVGIADTNAVVVNSVDAADDELCRFTATGIEGQTPAEVAVTMALDDIGVPDAAVDFDLQQATDLVVMTVANEAGLPAANVAVGQLCWATSELTLHVCTASV